MDIEQEILNLKAQNLVQAAMLGSIMQFMHNQSTIIEFYRLIIERAESAGLYSNLPDEFWAMVRDQKEGLLQVARQP